MLRWLGQCYARRIVNVNVNIVLAGVLALPPTLLAVWLAHRLGVPPGWRISLITFVTDIVSDVAVYFVLHWLANHWPALHVLRGNDPDAPPREHLSFFKDATLVQVERAALSPLLYFLLLGTQYLLIHNEMHPVPATAIAFAAGIGTTRALHTLWMLRQERRARAEFAKRTGAGSKCATTGNLDSGIPPCTHCANGSADAHSAQAEGGAAGAAAGPVRP